ncbi:hypothetical protein OH77DRAFT_619699 [Trametes cingulata]|nr:hypothetical protein OH77DRAFT_619699 [Trametes cingulata]
MEAPTFTFVAPHDRATEASSFPPSPAVPIASSAEHAYTTTPEQDEALWEALCSIAAQARTTVFPSAAPDSQVSAAPLCLPPSAFLLSPPPMTPAPSIAPYSPPSPQVPPACEREVRSEPVASGSAAPLQPVTTSRASRVANSATLPTSGNAFPTAGPSQAIQAASTAGNEKQAGPSRGQARGPRGQKRPRGSEADLEEGETKENVQPDAALPQARPRKRAKKDEVRGTINVGDFRGTCGMDGCSYTLTGNADADKKHLNDIHTTRTSGRFSCTVGGCARTFTTKGDRARHVIDAHWGWRYCCDVPGCSHSYGRQDMLDKHIRTAHGS